MSYTIKSAIDSGVFSDVIVSTDSEYYKEIAEYYGATVPFLRPKNKASSFSPDIEWVKHALKCLENGGLQSSYFSILRPTSPFRGANTIRRAWRQFCDSENIDSLRAVEKCSQHPAKMWKLKNNRMFPVLKGESGGVPWHSNQYTVLPEIFVQNACIEIAHVDLPLKYNTISGSSIMPFFTKRYEGVDINTEADWFYVKYLIKSEKASLPRIKDDPYKAT